MLTLCIILSACGSLIEPVDYSQNGLKITLDTSYKRSETYGYTACYASSVATVYLLREAFSDALSEEMTVRAYTEMVISQNALQADVREGDYCSFTYETISDDIHLKTLVATYKMSDCFWTVQFVCSAEYFEMLSVDFERFAASVEDVKASNS